jgi:hypothetical protein
MSFRIPWFQLASAAAAALGLAGLCWYQSLSSDDKALADGLAAEYAQRLYGRAADELTAPQRDHVNVLVRSHFTD